MILILLITIYNNVGMSQSSNSFALKQNPITIREKTFWKGSITVIPHSLYRGCGLASNGSFFLGDSGSLKRIDFKTGKAQDIIHAIHPEQYAFASVVSPDNQQVACYWFNGNSFDLIVVPSNPKGRNSMQPRLLVKGSSGASAFPYDWSPDGKWILVKLGDNGKEKIAMLSAKDGSIKVIKEMDKNWWCNKISFSPDGQHIVYDYNRNLGKSDIHLCRIDGTGEKIIVKDSAYAPYWSPKGNYISFITNQNSKSNLWNLWVLPMSETRVAGNPTLIKKGIDFFAPLGFIHDGSFLYGIASAVKLNIYVAELNAETLKVVGVPELVSTRFPDWNLNASWSHDGKYLAYNSRNEKGEEVILIRSTDKGHEEEIKTGSGSVIQWFPDITSLFIKGQGENALYSLNVTTKDTTFLFNLKPSGSDGRYHPILSGDGKLIFYIESNRTTSSSKVFSQELTTRVVKEITQFDSPDVTSFSASPDGKYLSMIVHYQGQSGRPSALRIVSLASGEVYDLFKEPWGDATKFFGLGWSPDSRYIYYVRTNNKTAANNIWRADILGGPQKNTGIAMTDLRMPRIHPDGKHIVFFGGDGWYKKTFKVKAIKIKSHSTQNKIRL